MRESCAENAMGFTFEATVLAGPSIEAALEERAALAMALDASTFITNLRISCNFDAEAPTPKRCWWRRRGEPCICDP
jgi:hypothetical protein